MIRSILWGMSTVALVTVCACHKDADEAAETHTTSGTPAPAEQATPPQAAAPELATQGTATGTGTNDMTPTTAPQGGAARDAGSHATSWMTGGSARDAGTIATPKTGRANGTHGSLPGATGTTTEPSVGPGHIMVPTLPGDRPNTGAPNSDGSHNIGR